MFHSFFSTILTIILGLFGLSIVVIAHELGHFLAARWMGIEVETFSIGWGKKILSKKIGKTEFAISLLPLGGYCRLKGEHSLIQAFEKELKEIPKEEGAFFSAPPWKRIIVSLAGPVFNLIFAILVSTTLFTIGYETSYMEPRIYLVSDARETTEVWASDEAELKSGDTIIAVNDKEITSYSELEEMIALSAGKELQLTVNRDGDILSLTATPKLNRDRGVGILGIYPYMEPVIDTIAQNSPAEKAGIYPGDKITAVNGKPVNIVYQYYFALDNSLEHQVITVEKAGIERDVQLQLDEGENAGIEFVTKTRRTPQMGLLKAVGEGTKETMDTLITTIKSFRMLFKGISMRNAVSGPLRITYYTGQMASAVFQDDTGGGIVLFVQFLSLISIALCFMNLLPIPALDGGQILLFLLEILKKKPLKPKMIYRYQVIGTLMVLGLILFALINDIAFFATK